MADCRYEVVWPESARTVHAAGLAPRLRALPLSTVAFVSDFRFKADAIFEAVTAELSGRAAGITTIPAEKFGNVHDIEEERAVADLPETLRANRVDAVVAGVGACGSCTPAVLRACAQIERAGIPTVAIVSTAFATMAATTARTLGVADLPMAVYPGVIMTDPQNVFEQKVRDVVAPAAVDALLRAPVVVADDRRDPAPRDIVFTGDYDEVMDRFCDEGWSDGLPITPPTIDRVEAFLRMTDRDESEIIGVLPPAHRLATVWSVAVNGVLAGCRPEYMPILLAVVEAVADPAFRLEDAGCTAGWEPLVTVSGPAVEQLGFTTTVGALRIGTRANSSIGRFLRLYLRNVAGLRPFPDETDQGAIGQNFHVALAEDEESVRALGWPPYRCDQGFAVEDSIVTVRGVVSVSAPCYSAGSRAEDHLRVLAPAVGDVVGPWAYTAYSYQAYHALLILGPSIAAAIAADGVDKDGIRQYLFDHTLVDGDRAQRYAHGVSGRDFNWAALAAEGKAPAELADLDPVGQVRALLHAGSTDIVVAGSRGRNQSKILVGQHRQGTPVSRLIRFPDADR